MNTYDIGSKIEKLPDHVIPEVIDYIDSMLSRYGLNNNTSNFTFGWEGKLSKLRDKYTSIELQHKSLEWR